jgi:hypothetical protein
MKKMVLAAVAALSLAGAIAPVANAANVADLSSATRMQQTGAYSR